jgi:hypothetical protein
MCDEVDPDAGFAEFVDLWAAATADDLHRVLALSLPVRRSADAFEPFQLLVKHHEIEPDASIVTAMLLLTARRWRNGVSQLARRIAEADILDASELNLLAETFVAADDAVYWAVPDHWLGDEVIVIEIDADAGLPADAPAERDGPAVVRREVPPPLRRWGTGWLVRRDPGRWGPLFARARALDSRSGAAVMCGLLDAIEDLPAPSHDLLTAEAVRWPDHAVRKIGLDLVADAQGPAAAYELARDDPNARIRTWAESLLRAAPYPRAGHDNADKEPGADAGATTRDQGFHLF